MAFDFFGQVSAMFEWGFAWVLLWPEDGVLRKEEVRRLLDGSIYQEKTMTCPVGRIRKEKNVLSPEEKEPMLESTSKS